MRRPRLLTAACACIGIAVLLTAAGIGLELLPEGFAVEWNEVPLSEYDLGDLAGGIVLFGLAGAVLAGTHLRRTREETPQARRRLARVLVLIGLIPLVAVAAIVALVLAVCSGGACA